MSRERARLKVLRRGADNVFIADDGSQWRPASILELWKAMELRANSQFAQVSVSGAYLYPIPKTKGRQNE